MSLRYALLASLSAGPMTGYEISRQYQSAVGHVWHAPDSQIYPELRKMEDDGLVEGENADDGPRATKRFYRITAAGEDALRAWMETPLRYARERDPVHVKAAYFEWTTTDAARRTLLDHIAHHRRLLEQWEQQILDIDERTNPVLLRRLAGLPEDDARRVAAFKRFTYEGLVLRAESEIAWAERGLRLLER